MKRRILSVLCLALTLAFLTPLTAIVAEGLWLSPLAVFGDVNNDGYLNAADARIILRASSRLIRLSPPQLWNHERVYGDVDGDGVVTAADARIVLRWSSRLDPIPDEPPPIKPPVVDPGKPPVYTNDSALVISGRYYLKGKLTLHKEYESDKEIDLDYAVNGGQYCNKNADFDGVKLTALFNSGLTLTLINPNKQIYRATNAAELVLFGYSLHKWRPYDDVPSFGSTAANKGEPIATGEYFGDSTKLCNIYKYTNENQSFAKHYREGNTLVGVKFYDTKGKHIATLSVDTLSMDINSMFTVPADYNSVSSLYFIK